MSDIYRKGLSPQTKSISSSRNRLFAVSSQSEAVQVALGVVSSFAPSDARNTEAVRGIGFGDQIAELVPGMSDPISITLNRTALYHMNIFQALGYKGGIDGVVRALKHHRWPFDLRQEVVISEVDTLTGGGIGEAVGGTGPEAGIDAPRVIATLYAGCWITQYGSTFNVDTALVAEDVTLTVTDIFAWNGTNKVNTVPSTDAGSKANSQIYPGSNTPA